jgi:hypothetical protein
MTTTARQRVNVGHATSSSTNSYLISSPSRPVTTSDIDPKVENAVFAYIQARRALGSNQINSTDIAAALRLSRPVVEKALKRMTGRGIKIR